MLVSNENATQILSVGLILTPLYPGNGMSENKCVGKIHKKNFIRNLKKEIQHTKTKGTTPKMVYIFFNMQFFH
jgi:hypothetical protein